MSKIKKKFMFILTICVLFFGNSKIALGEQYSYKSADGAFGSGKSRAGDNSCTNAKGSLTGTTNPYGYRISLIEKTGKNSWKTISIYDRIFGECKDCLYDSEHKNKLGNTAPYAYNAQTPSKQAYTTLGSPSSDGTARISFTSVGNKFKDIFDNTKSSLEPLHDEDLLAEFGRSDFYKLMTFLADIANVKNIYACNPSDSKTRKKEDPNRNCSLNDSNTENLKKYLRLVDRTYIMIEPIFTIWTGDEDDWYKGDPVCRKGNGVTLKDVTSTDGFLKYLGFRWGGNGETTDNVVCNAPPADPAYYENYYKYCTAGAGAEYFNLLTTLKNLLNSTTHKPVYYTDTISNLAELNVEYKYISNVNFQDASKYLDGSKGVDTTFPKFTKWEKITDYEKAYKLIQNDDYAYGLNIAHLNFQWEDGKCHYEKGMDRPTAPVLDMLLPDYCCYDDAENVKRWEDYDSTKPVGEQSKELLNWKKNPNYKTYCPDKIDECGEEQYKMILRGDNLDTTMITIKGKQVKLRTCCDYDAYKKSDGTSSLDKLKKEDFEEKVKNYCYGCSINEYNAIVADGEANPNTRPVPILKKDAPTYVDKNTKRTYEYCCHYENYGENQLPDDITKDNFGLKFSDLYCLPSNKKCSEEDFNKLLEWDKKISEGLVDEKKLNKDKNKIVYEGERVTIKKCCDIDSYDKALAQTLNQKNNLDRILQPAPPNFAENGKLKINICQETVTDYCSYSVLDKATKVEDTLISINGKKYDCCKWESYGKNDDERAKNSTYDSKEEFESSSKYLALCTPSCVWNGDKTQATQYINGEEKNCCLYSNYGATAKEKLATYKDTFVNGVKSQSDLSKTAWYKNQPACNEKKCSLSKMKVDDKVFADCCSEEIDSFGENDQILLRPYGSVPSYLAINEPERFYSLCKSSREFCSYTVSPQCPDCNGDAFSTGKTVDTVNGEDSTLFTVSDSVLKCIVKNELGGPTYDGYLYEDLGSEYCPVLCTQKVEYDYPKKSTLSVQGGRYIPTSAIQPKINTVLTCRINKVDIKQFESDLKAAKAELEAAYEAYSKAKIPLNNNQAKINTKNESGVNGECDCKNEKYLGSANEKETCCDATKDDKVLAKSQISFTWVYHNSYDATKTQGTYSQSDCPSGKWVTTTLDTKSGTVANSPACTTYCEGYTSKSYVANCSGVSGTYTSNTKCRNAGGTVSDGTCTCSRTVTLSESEQYCSVKPDPTYSCGNDDYTLSGTTCIYNKTAGKDCESTTGGYKCKSYSCSSSINISGTNTGTKAYLKSSTTGETDSPTCKYEYCSNKNYTRYNSQTVQTYQYAVNDSKTQAAQTTKTCENKDDYYEKVYKKEVEQTKKRLTDAKKAYENVIENFQKCFKVDEQMRTYSDYEVKLHLDYLNGEDGNPYAVSTYLTDSVSVGTANNFKFELYTYSKCDLPFDWANGGHGKLTCSNQTMNIFANAKNEIYTAQATRNFIFTLPDTDVYKYVNKNSFSEKEKNINSVMIGSHLPIAFNEKGKSVVVKLKAEFTGSIIKPKFEEDLCTNEYICEGGVSEPCVEPVYRPISLSKPFLDEDGSVRNTGINWCDGTDCSSNNALVQKVITNNRGVTTDQVYKLTPLYTIRLTPSIVKKIRFYNSITTYGDYNLICDEGTGRHCKSVYIRGGAAIDGSNVTNDLTSIKAVDYSRSCALTENLSGCKPGDFYEKR